MAYPTGIITREVVLGPIYGPTGAPVTGNAVLTASTAIIQLDTDSTVLAGPLTVPLSNGIGIIELPVSRQPDLINASGEIIESFTYLLEWQITADPMPNNTRFELLLDFDGLNVLPDVPIPDAVTVVGIVDYKGLMTETRINAERAELAEEAALNALAAANSLWLQIQAYAPGGGGGLSIDTDGVPYIDPDGTTGLGLDTDGVAFYVLLAS